MGFILTAVVVAGGISYAILTSLLADECKAWLPWIIETVTRRAVRNLPADQRERYNEEWRSHLGEIPGNIGTFFAALGFLWTGWRLSSERASQLPEEPKPAKPGKLHRLVMVLGTPVPKDMIKIISESDLREFIVKSALDNWQRPISGRLICLGRDGAEICMTKQGIDLSYKGETASCAHDPATRAAFEALLSRQD